MKHPIEDTTVGGVYFGLVEINIYIRNRVTTVAEGGGYCFFGYIESRSDSRPSVAHPIRGEAGHPHALAVIAQSVRKVFIERAV